MLLRPIDIEQFFVNYQNGKCSKQVVGINKIGNQPKIIAKFLKLPNPECYTGHCFRRSGATILADATGDIMTVKNFGGWKSTPVMESYIEHSLAKKEKIGNAIVKSINTQENNLENIQKNVQTFGSNILASSSECNNTVVENNYAELELKKESISYKDCTFHNCTFVIKK